MDWSQLYEQRKMTPQEAVSQFVQDGDGVFLGGLAIAEATMKEVIAQAKRGEKKGLTLHGNLILNQLPLDDPELTPDKLRYKCFFYGGYERAGSKYGSVTFVPLQFSSFARYMEQVKPEVVIIPVTPPDAHGNCNIGPLSAGYNPAAVRNCKTIIAEVNEFLPRVFGRELDIPVHRISAFVEHHQPIIEYPASSPSKIDAAIANYILDMIPDGACIQLGLGGMSNAVGYGLKEKKHLGIHTEMLTESMIELIKCGAVDNSRKGFMPGRSLVSFTLGKQSQYDFVRENPALYFGPYEYVNDVSLIAQNDNMISINTAISVDLTGQACSESIGFRQFSGTGGQVDYVRGASYAKGGKSFLAISSPVETKTGLASRIVLDFPIGGTTTTLRSETQYVVTEYGCAKLWGEDLPTRAKRLIEIAHPDFRDRLTFEAKKAHLLY